MTHMEDFGLVPKGEVGAWVRANHNGLDGKCPVNTHGGLLSESYVQGLNHVIEAVQQLRPGGVCDDLCDGAAHLRSRHLSPGPRCGNRAVLRRRRRQLAPAPEGVIMASPDKAASDRGPGQQAVLGCCQGPRVASAAVLGLRAVSLAAKRGLSELPFLAVSVDEASGNRDDKFVCRRPSADRSLCVGRALCHWQGSSSTEPASTRSSAAVSWIVPGSRSEWECG